MIQKILKSIYDRTKSTVLVIVVLLSLSSCYTLYEIPRPVPIVAPYDYNYYWSWSWYGIYFPHYYSMDYHKPHVRPHDAPSRDSGRIKKNREFGNRRK
jgi:hypothetical protein